MVPDGVIGDSLWEFTYVAIAAALAVARLVLVVIEFRFTSLLISPFFFAILAAAWIAARYSGFGSTLATTLFLVPLGLTPFVLLENLPSTGVLVVLGVFEVWFAVSVALTVHGAANLSPRMIQVGAAMQLALVGWRVLVWFANRANLELGPGFVASTVMRAVFWAVVMVAALKLLQRDVRQAER